MWDLKAPRPVKLIVGILAADHECLHAAIEAVDSKFGKVDLESDVWLFDQTDYYKEQIGEQIYRQFVSVERLIDPGRLAAIKRKTNKIEKKLATRLALSVPRPINLDPGIIEPSKLVLATTKNYSHRIYLGKNIYAEVTLVYDKARWRWLDYTYSDYKQKCYHDFFKKVRTRLMEQLKSLH